MGMSMTRMAGYPRKTISKNGNGWIDKMKGTVSEAFEYPIILGSVLEYSLDTAGYGLESAVVGKDDSGSYGEIELSYAPVGGMSVITDDNNYDPSLDISELEKPLSFHPAYLTKWEYDLAGSSSASEGTPPTFYEAATNTVITGDDALNYRWIKDPSELPESTWKILFSRWKPGREGYWVPNQTMTYSKKYSSYKKAITAATNAYKRITPKINFGLPTGATATTGEWLQGPTRIYKIGRNWNVDFTYRYSANGRVFTGATYSARVVAYQGWDHDLYAEGTNTSGATGEST
jgi:hypothetical protein